jgi:hypothetical protein
VLTTQRDRYETWFVRKPVTVVYSGEGKISFPNPHSPLRQFESVSRLGAPMQKLMTGAYSKPFALLQTKYDVGWYLSANEPDLKSCVCVGLGGGNFVNKFLKGLGSSVKEFILVTGLNSELIRTEDPRRKRADEYFRGQLQWQNKTGNAYIWEMTSEDATRVFRKSISPPATPDATRISNDELVDLSRTYKPPQAHQQVDIVYLSSAQDYCNGMKDILLWWPLISPNGILMGSEFHWHEDEFPPCPGTEYVLNEPSLAHIELQTRLGAGIAGSVPPPKLKTAGIQTPNTLKATVGGFRTALFEWAEANDLQVSVVTSADRPHNFWMVRKPVLRGARVETPRTSVSHKLIPKNIWIAVASSSEIEDDPHYAHVKALKTLNPEYTVNVWDNERKDKFMRDNFGGSRLAILLRYRRSICDCGFLLGCYGLTKISIL